MDESQLAELFLDKMKVAYGFGKGKVFWVDKNLLSKLREIPIVKMHTGFTASYLIIEPQLQKRPKSICLLLRLYSRGAPWVSVTSLLLARLIRLMQTLLCLCHYFQMSFSLFIKMSSDKDSAPSLSPVVCHQTFSRIPSISQWLTDIFLTATEAYWYLLSPRNIRKDCSPFLWSCVSHVVENLHHLL